MRISQALFTSGLDVEYSAVAGDLTDVMSSKISATREAFWLPSVEDAGYAKQIQFINFRACRA
jgi:hypothetical protein